ncbi:MAG: sugar ABC transporter permease [Clostridia bacterium]|nr:sugar ABC transporter permease [Clostridia bacterium]
MNINRSCISLHKSKNPFVKDIITNPLLYLMIVPLVAFYIIFCYVPMYGAVIAFKDYSPGVGIFKSPWTSELGFHHFKDFISGPYFSRVFGNTIVLGFADLIFGFPAPLIFALMLNELKSLKFKKICQTITYIPHFISLVVVCGLLQIFLGREGIVSDLIALFGGERANLLAQPQYFKTIFVASGVWQEVGWGSIVYLSALGSIDPGLYEAAEIDGAGRFGRVWHVTLPGIIPTIVTLLILKTGKIFSVSFEKIILLCNDMTIEKAEVISSFVYKRGLVDMDYSYSTAIGLLNSVLNFIIIFATNYLCRRVSETSLW